MADNLISDRDLLNFAFENGMLNSTTILDMYMTDQRNKILEKHPCQIWQGKNNGLWYTYIKKPDGKKLKGNKMPRILIRGGRWVFIPKIILNGKLTRIIACE